MVAVLATKLVGGGGESAVYGAGGIGLGQPGSNGGAAFGNEPGGDESVTMMTLQEAYLQGYTDASAQKESMPPPHDTRAYDPTADERLRQAVASAPPVYLPPPAESGGGFGIGSLFSLVMVGSYLYRAGGGGGGGGWSLPMLIASFKANPMQGVMMLMMISRLF